MAEMHGARGIAPAAKMDIESGAQQSAPAASGAAPAFEWRDLSVDIGEKRVLHGAESRVFPGELFCILGPSGAGKTTLLSALCGDRACATGSVHFYGELLSSADTPVPPSTRARRARDLAFVRQKDIFMESLTVRETLLFTARLRMARSTSLAEKTRRVDEVVSDLGLDATVGTSIGSTMQRGVSGGELKRVNIANEVLAHPRVLVCDEPTSGLDSAYALVVMRGLREHARRHGVAVICSIHQPSSQICELVDSWLLLAPGGHQVFCGRAPELLPYLTARGFPAREHYTISDHAMDLLADGAAASALASAWPAHAAAHTARREGGAHALLGPGVRPPERSEHGPGFLEQAYVLMRRQVRQSRGTLLSRTEITLNVLVGAVSGLIWFQQAVASGGADGGGGARGVNLKNVEGAIFFFVAHMSWWPMFLYLFSFPAEQAVLAKERRVGTYSIEAYALAKAVSELPQELVCPSVYFVICLPMIGFRPLAAVTIWLVSLLHYQTSAAIGMLVSILAPVTDSNTAASAVMTLQMTAGGYLVDVSTLPTAFAWLPKLSVWHYSTAVMMRAAVGEASTGYSQLSDAGNLLVLATFVLGLKLAVYLALKTSRRLEFQ